MQYQHNNKKKIVFDNKYILQNKIGEGGFSNVFQLKIKKRKKDQVPLCIKVFHRGDTNCDNEKILQEVNKEIFLSQTCNHNNLIKIFTKGELKKNKYFFNYIIMEHHSCDLFDFFSECEDFSTKQVIDIGGQIGSALLALHKNNYLHLDVKPENILFNKKFNTWILCDLSSCINYNDSEALQKFDPAVTVQFAAPELITENVSTLLSPQTDIYALGCVLYLCLCEMDFIPDRIAEDYDGILIFQQIQSKHRHHQLVLKAGPFNKFGIALNNEEICCQYTKWYSLYKDKMSNDIIDLLRCSLECNPELRYNSEQFLDHINKLEKL